MFGHTNCHGAYNRGLLYVPGATKEEGGCNYVVPKFTAYLNHIHNWQVLKLSNMVLITVVCLILYWFSTGNYILLIRLWTPVCTCRFIVLTGNMFNVGHFIFYSALCHKFQQGIKQCQNIIIRQLKTLSMPSIN